MKQGASFYSFAQDVNVEEAMRICGKAGYDGVEPVLSENGYLNMKSSDADVLRIGRLARENGLEIPSVGVWSLWEYNLASNDPARRRTAEDIVKKQLEVASALGADTVLVVPGSVGNDFSQTPEFVRYDIAYDRVQESLSGLAAYARAAGVCIGIENVWNRFLLSPIELRRFIDEIGSEFVGAYFDVGNILYIGYPDQWIDILGPRIKKIHFSDYRAGQAGLGAFVDLLAGDVDFAAVMAALRRIGYNGYVTLEMLPNYKEFPYVSMFANKHAMDAIVKL